jgi:hypothetical protein
MVTRRTLTFATLDDAVRDAEHLLSAGYDAAGTWDLARICGHLVEWMRFPMDGFPRVPLLLRPAMWAMRHTIGPRELKTLLVSGRMRSAPTLPATVPPAGGDPAAAVARLRETVGRVTAYTGTVRPSPFFGPMTRDEWIGLNRVHAAHHLSFLVPKA